MLNIRSVYPGIYRASEGITDILYFHLTVYLPSASASAIISFSSSSVGLWPNEFITASSSSTDIVPEQSVSNNKKASLNS